MLSGLQTVIVMTAYETDAVASLGSAVCQVRGLRGPDADSKSIGRRLRANQGTSRKGKSSASYSVRCSILVLGTGAMLFRRVPSHVPILQILLDIEIWDSIKSR